MQVNPSDSVALSRATSLHLVLAWDSCTFGEQGGEKWRADRVNTQSFSGLSRACVPSLKTGMQGGAAIQGGVASLLRSKGPCPSSVAVDGSECPGCWTRILSGHFFQLRKRRMGLPRRKAGQGRWPGQVALVSRFPAAISPPTPLSHATRSLHATRHLGLVRQ